MNVKIDKIDKLITDELVVDGRLSCKEIANRIGNITERSVRYRLERLIQKGIITIRANVNSLPLGFTVAADIFIEVEPGMVTEIAEKLKTFETISYVACSTGERDISVQIFARDNLELFNFVSDVIGKIPGVRRTQTYFVPYIVKDDHRWKIPTSCVEK